VVPNTTVDQIARHLAPYAAWLAGRNGEQGRLCLFSVRVLSDSAYLESIAAGEEILSPPFLARTRLVWGDA